MDQDGQPLRVVTLPMPAPVLFDGQRLPASYANFYIANDLVLVPTFNDPADRVALNTLAELFPDREVVGIHCLDLVLGLGTLHCLSQQQPRPPCPPENRPQARQPGITLMRFVCLFLMAWSVLTPADDTRPPRSPGPCSAPHR